MFRPCSYRREANLSKAEKALQHGCSDPNRLNIPKVSDGEGISLAFGALFVWKICGYIGTLYILYVGNPVDVFFCLKTKT